MNVGDAVRRSGLPAKTIRYYEEIGLIRPARAGNCGDDIHRLTFLRRSCHGDDRPHCRILDDIAGAALAGDKIASAAA
ncbi:MULTISPECIES: MerR family DNA-binding transcriptional regulator [unclassified Mesorhizobium]|uniref:MerR family DNA-binding transcriptional regulator n=1 Tax=unclassified Mesorhizobium TaxID=325217 RepID=UPI000FD37817|nr:MULTISPECIES: MerR family DNA-binding transcriptional regulator [unclassified Mesorhizobium]RUU46695.1 MerR family DNA-binding transcriptional regulator [Mesorhizobium sp. M6A.T.Ca.TU.002.02.2.1]RVB76950.1 MerR family DNA-binding transcriptional regulator [Mesorhizobium sp. M6A.T.Cr.TU.014.01.1.1]RWN38299.1 MAG: MerR family DNA-binding transcriptional regulator [Mesorhizobium sp.]RWN67287.1 MAG: MerR family DNA-binding transcriptional regulator [Mesorhizobium sp.]RWP78109.1 MAG: MerR family